LIEEIEIHTADGTADAFLYQPEAERHYPGVIHLTDVGGIRPAQQEMARRLASEGYAVLVPNVFYCTRKPPVFDFPAKLGDERMKRVAELSAPLTSEAMERDACAYVDFLAAHNSVSRGPIGVAGYCLTGKMALYIARAAGQDCRGGIVSRGRAGHRHSGQPTPGPAGHRSAALFRARHQRPEHAGRGYRKA
jgi:carboxymethylenebutenolidase